jgi:serine/threonine-protein kinase
MWRSRVLVIVAVSLSAALVPAAEGAVSYGKPIVAAASSTVTVPSVVGAKSSAAKRMLAAVGLRSSVRTVVSSRPAGTVVAQRPAAHTAARRGTTVRLSVATAGGAQANGRVAVPDVIGQEQDAAQQRLEAAGLAADVAYAHSLELVGTVVTEAPLAGASVAKGTHVTITLSNGPGP